jgi:hypothetical protein
MHFLPTEAADVSKDKDRKGKKKSSLGPVWFEGLNSVF